MSVDYPGLKYSQRYAERRISTRDSERMRRRIDALFTEVGGYGNSYKVALTLKRELGVEIDATGGYYQFDRFFEKSLLNDLLDSITVCYQLPLEGKFNKERWITEIERIFREENVDYTIDKRGGVLLYIDNEFIHNKSSIIDALSDKRYAGVRDALENSYNSLNGSSIDEKASVRYIFESLEVLFRLIYPKTHRLGSSEIKNNLKPTIEQRYSKDKTALRASLKIVESFSEWVESAHFYRHGQGEESIIQPPLDLTVLLISNGASFLRWLAQLDSLLCPSEQLPPQKT